MKKLLLIAVLATSLSACITTPDGKRKFDRVKACNTALTAATTVKGLANVLVLNGVAAEKADDIAQAAFIGELTITTICDVLVAQQTAAQR